MWRYHRHPFQFSILPSITFLILLFHPLCPYTLPLFSSLPPSCPHPVSALFFLPLHFPLHIVILTLTLLSSFFILLSSCFHLVHSLSLPFLLFLYFPLSILLPPLLSSFLLYFHLSFSTFIFPSLSSSFAPSQNEKDPGLTLLLSRVFSKKGGGFLLSHIALQYHRRKRA